MVVLLVGVFFSEQAIYNLDQIIHAMLFPQSMEKEGQSMTVPRVRYCEEIKWRGLSDRSCKSPARKNDHQLVTPANKKNPIKKIVYRVLVVLNGKESAVLSSFD